MGNLVKKVIASTLCASFLSFQTAFGYQMTGDVLGNNTVTGGTGANGANIVSSSGGFQGFENGGLPEGKRFYRLFPLRRAGRNESLRFRRDASGL